MKRLLPVFILLLAAGTLRAQVPNGGFESWTAGSPDGWLSSGVDIPGSVTQSATAHGGSSAARGDVVNVFINIPPILAVGEDGTGFPSTQRYATLSGYYQFTSVGGDAFTVVVGMIRGGEVIGGGAMLTTTTQSGYAAFDIPIIYAAPDAPDSAFIQIFITDTATGQVDIGSYFIVDDISLSGTTGVDDGGVLPYRFGLAQNYPNPFNPSTSISFSIATESFVSLRVFDVLGREVGALVSETLPPGNYAREWNASGQPGGVYFCRLEAGGLTETRKLLLAK